MSIYIQNNVSDCILYCIVVLLLHGNVMHHNYSNSVPTRGWE